MKRFAAIILVLALLLCVIKTSVIAEDDSYGTVEDVIRSGFYSFCDSIDISKFEITPENLGRVIADVIKDDPYLFFVNDQMSYSYRVGGGVISLKPTYIYCGEEAFRVWDECRAFVREMAQEANKYDSHYEIALFLHDYICLNFEYDETFENDSIYSFLKHRKGTCQAYTHLYTAVLRECGIEVHFVASDTIEHIWNYVKIDGEWYHVDLTWDDSSKAEEPVSKRHFLCSDRLALERGHRDWYSAVEVICSSERFADVGGEDGVGDLKLVLDVDVDGEITFADLLILRRYIKSGDVSISPMEEILDCDLQITPYNVELLRKKLLQLH